MNAVRICLFAAVAAALTLGACSNATEGEGGGSAAGYTERASPVITQQVVKKGGASVSFRLLAAWGNSCGTFSRAQIAIEGDIISVKVIGREPTDAVCEAVMSSFTAPVTVDLPKHGKYRFLFWQSDTSAIDTTFVIK